MRRALGILFSTVLICAFGYGVWRMATHRAEDVCMACQRPAASMTRTTGIVDGKPEVFCCPACALTETKQSGKKVVITSLTDHETGKPMPPENAFLVKGSDMNHCLRGHDAHVNADKRPMESHFDRCNPSLMAFSSRQAAARFQRVHGGEIITFQQLIQPQP